MTLEELKAALEAANKQDLYESVLTLVETEKNKGVESSRKKNSENQNLRRYKQAVESLGYVDGDLDEFTQSIAKTKGNKSDMLTMKSLQGQIDALKKERDNAIKSADNGTIKGELNKALGDRVYGADLLINSLISDGKVALANGSVVFKEGDNVVTMEDGIKNILETRKDLVKNTQAPGNDTKKVSGSNPSIQAIINSGDKDAIAANITEIAAEYGIKM